MPDTFMAAEIQQGSGSGTLQNYFLRDQKNFGNTQAPTHDWIELQKNLDY